MSERIVEKIIGAAYVAHNNNFFAADIYEGNYYKILENNNTVKTVPIVTKEYERVLSQYKECVDKEIKITSAYELNQRAHHNFDVPTVTADPDAAEKEWYIRTHPQVVEVPEPEVKKKGLFGKKKKKSIGIKCQACGAVNPDTQKFCGECGEKLPTADEEILASGTVKKEVVESKKSAPVVKEIKQETEEDDDVVIMDEEPSDNEKVVESENLDETEKKKEKKPKKKRKTGLIIFIVLLIILLAGGIGAGVYLYMTGGFEKVVFDSTQQPVAETAEPAKPAETVQPSTSRVVIKLKNNIAMNQQIKEEDVEGTILSEEQFNKYNSVSTYIDKNGQKKVETLLLWENKDDVIGKYATRELAAGSILYDTSITSEHIVADKTFVDVEVDGEGNTIEVESNALPGNTRIQIVAIVQTDGGEPQQVLLSEMTLQDRSLESIFNSAGQDILEMLSTESETKDTTKEEDTAKEAVAETSTEENAETEGE